MNAGGRIVRLLARATSFLYPAWFRRTHRRDLTDAADHLYAREVARRPRVRATLAASRLIVTDALTTSPALWLAAIAENQTPAPAWRMAARRAGAWFAGGRHDLYIAARSVTRRPGITLLVAGTLGLGIGASTTAFDALDRIVLHPLPFANSDRLALVMMREMKRGYSTTPSLDLVAKWRTQADALDGVEIFRGTSAIYMKPDGAEVLDGLGISGGLPVLVGVSPVAGRMLGPADAEPGAPATVMLTEQWWRRDFGANSAIVGQSITLGSTPTTVVGIWPAGARLDLTATPQVVRVLPRGAEYGRGSLATILVRRVPGRTVADVEQQLRSLAPPAAPNASEDYQPSVHDPARLMLGDAFVSGVWIVFWGALVLLAAALAAGHLLLERATSRSHELGVRAALGGSAARLLRLFLSEGIVYATLAVAVGAALTVALEHAIAIYEPRLFSDAAGAGLGGRAFFFAAIATVVASLTCALAPLLRAGRRDLAAVIGRANQTRLTGLASRSARTFVAAQAALAVVLVFGAVIMIRSTTNLLRVDPGIAIDQLAELSISLPSSRYPPAARQPFLDRAREALASMPGVQALTTSGMPILQTSHSSGWPRLEGEQESDSADADTALASVAPNYFDVMGIRLLAGRMFEFGEKDVALVNDAFARARGGDVLGKRVFTPRSTTPATIVGVVSDVRLFGLADRSSYRPELYFASFAGPADSYVRFILRTNGDPEAVIHEARRRIAAIDTALPLLAPQTGMDVVRRQTAQHRFVSMLLSGLAGLGFLLAMSGVYAVVSLGVVRRKREIGLRMALGARPDRLVRAFVRASLAPVITGVTIGIAIAWLAAPLVDTLLFHVTPRDPLSTAAGLTVVIGVATLAALWPARRVAHVDPARTLREM